MQRTAPTPHREGNLSLGTTEAANPEWAPWLRLIRRAGDAIVGGWAVDVGLSADRMPEAPLLHGAVIAVDAGQVRGFLDELRRTAAEELGLGSALGDPMGEEETLELVAAAVAFDAPRLEAVASAGERDPAPVAALVNLAVMPLLVATRRRIAGELPQSWTRGYCGCCSAWPVFAEVRGLERERQARCGRCAFAWRFDVLRCPYCDERAHESLRSLTIEGDEVRRVDTCRTCGGYLKSMQTLMAVPDESVAARDAGSVDLDLVAEGRGFARPERQAFPLSVEIVPRGAHGVGDGRTWFLA